MSQFLIFFISLFLVACSDGSKSQRLPKPGQTTLTQIYILSGADSTSGAADRLWSFPQPRDLEVKVGARVEAHSAKTLAEAVEILRVWNARPVDILILKEGLPVEAWNSVQLPKVGGRAVLIFAPGQIEVDQARVHALLKFLSEKNICNEVVLKKGQAAKLRIVPENKDFASNLESKCVVSLGTKREYTAEGSLVAVNVLVDWEGYFKNLLDRRKVPGTLPTKLSFSNALLRVERGPYFAKDKDIQRFDALLQEWSLSELH